MTATKKVQRYEATCDQCGLPVGNGGVERSTGPVVLRFCCHGCSITNAIIGAKGEAGSAGLFLARLGVSAFLSANIMLLSWVIYDHKWIAFGVEPLELRYFEAFLFVLATPIIFLLGYPYLIIAVRDARALRLSVDTLIVMGSFTAYAYSSYEALTGGPGMYFDTATMTLVLVTAGRYLESHAKTRTTSEIRKLIDLQPLVARVVRRGKDVILPSAMVRTGATLRILPGERVPLDGVVLDGSTSVDESTLTGESLPRVRVKGNRVYAATVNLEGAILVKSVSTSSETVHAHTVHIMEVALRTRSPVHQLVDRLASRFIPLVLVTAFACFAGWMVVTSLSVALTHALTVLVVACPCALGIGTPLATTIALGKAASQGILIKNTRAVEVLAEAKYVVFDKTGILTRGEPSICGFECRGDKQEFLSMVASLERHSGHPYAKAIVQYAESERAESFKVRNVRTIPGSGVKGEVCVRKKWLPVVVGSAPKTRNRNGSGMRPGKSLSLSDDSALWPSVTNVFVEWNGRLQGRLDLSDTIRHNAVGVVDDVRKLVSGVLMISGDSRAIVQDIARRLNISDAWGGCDPGKKVKMINDVRKKGRTIMVGDGINDAPSLAASDVGITLGSSTDLAKDSADIMILGDHLEGIPWAIRLARQTVRIIQGNLFWAFFYNFMGISLAVAGVLKPVWAALAMILSSLFIIVNSHRIGKSLGYIQSR